MIHGKSAVRPWYALAVALWWAGGAAADVAAQAPPGEQGSRNVHILAHIPLSGALRVADVEVEQELARPYAYVSMRLKPAGFHIINLKDLTKAQPIYAWRIENGDLHRGAGALAPAYLKSHGRYYFAQSFQFAQDGPDMDLGAIIFDVTGLPDTSTISEVARIRAPEYPGGFHEDFAYKHSSGPALLFTTTTGPYAYVYDIDRVASGASNQGPISRIPIPFDSVQAGIGNIPLKGYHDFYVGYDPATQRDRFYGAGAGGYYVYDVTDLREPKLLTSLTGISGVTWGHTFTPDPTGRYAVTGTEYRYAPLRLFDLKPGLDGPVRTISRPIGAWTADWKGLPHNTEVRWPYVFVSHYEQGLQVFNMMDPANPYTVGYYDTFDGPDGKGLDGAFGVDVRNADGLIVVSDLTTGFWAFKMDGFDGWNGHQWGVPNISSAQDWDNGPDGAPKPQKVS